MVSSHRYLQLDQVEPGMTLADELLDGQGKVLLPAGAVLTESILARLPSHGIDALPIAVPPAQAEASVDRDAVLARLAHVFRGVDPHDPAQASTRLLRRLVQEYRLEGTTQ
ncbi:MAG TPA: hypothetical protein VFT37_08665 [Telluria sp.]|nr:hypothetical protein [Telluria sp.]